MHPKPEGSEQGHKIELLSLTQGWKRNPEAFARPGPPPKPPLPLKFTCRGCGSRVDPETGVCSGCKKIYDF